AATASQSRWAGVPPRAPQAATPGSMEAESVRPPSAPRAVPEVPTIRAAWGAFRSAASARPSSLAATALLSEVSIHGRGPAAVVLPGPTGQGLTAAVPATNPLQ